MDDIDREIEECAGWSDERLTEALAEAVRSERKGLITLLIRLGEFYNRDLSLKYGYPSAYAYCMRKHGYSRTGAARRIAAARVGKSYRSALRLLAAGRIHLTAVAMLERHLTDENHESLLERACGKSEEQIDQLIALIAPRLVPKDRVRAIRMPLPPEAKEPPAPAREPACPPPASSPPSEPADLFGAPLPAEQGPDLEPELYEISFPATAETRNLLARAKEVLRHRFPQARTDQIVRLALEKLLAEVDRDLRRPRKRGRPARPGSASRDAKRGRYIPEGVKQESWERDGGQCAFVAADGTRCAARAWLEFDHERPFAKGGTSLDSRNVRPLCFQHNQWAARQGFGDKRGGRAA